MSASPGAVLTRTGVGLAVGSLALTVGNLRSVRVPDATARPTSEPLTVLLPLRDEADNVVDCLTAILVAADLWPGPVTVRVLDDESTDSTATLVSTIAARESRVTLVHGRPTPAGWLGKPWACAQLAAGSTDGVIVFVDADVRVKPHAFTSAAALLRSAGLDVVCPYPRQQTASAAERLVQPLLQWSWMSTLPLRLAERSPRPSLTAGNGQLFVVDADAYHRAGGHAAVRAEVLEDIALVRAIKAVGGRGGVVEGSAVADCRMYDGWQSVHAGYRKSLWAAFGSPLGAILVSAILTLAYVVPPLAAVLTRSRAGTLGYLAGVTSRVLVARRTGGRAWPDALAHPVSISLFSCLTVDSVISRRRGVLRWKGRPVEVGADG